MRKSVYFILFILLPTLLFSQKRKLIEGKFIAKDIDLSFIHIVNKSSKQVSYSNQHGAFKIRFQKGDSLYISAIQIENRYFVVSQNTIKNKQLIIQLKAKSNAIKDVVIKNHHLTGNLSLDAQKSPNKDSLIIKSGALDFRVAYNLSIPMKPDQQAKDKAITKGLSGTDPTRVNSSINILTGIALLATLFINKEKQKIKAQNRRKQLLKKQKIALLNKEDHLENKLIALYGKDFFTKELKIPTLKITDFIVYCQEKSNLAQLIIYKNEIKLIETLINESKNYLQLIKKE